MNKSAAKSDLGSLQPPFVHFCVGKNPESLMSTLEKMYPGSVLIPFDGREIQECASFSSKFCNPLGMPMLGGSTGGLFWDQLEDAIRTDIFAAYPAALIIFIKNAEFALRSEPEGLIGLANAMHIAGEGHANPMQGLGAVAPQYATQPRPIHTVFCFGRVPKNAPNAQLLNLWQ